MIGAIVQIIISIIFVCLLAIIGYSIYNAETLNALNNYNTVRKTTNIFDGVLDFKNNQSSSFNTMDKLSASYVDLSPSINQNGGAEYSYNFWLWFDSSKLVSIDDICLLLRGNKTLIKYNNDDNCFAKDKKYIITKNPLIRMRVGNTEKSIIVEYNTIGSPDAYRDGGYKHNNCSGTDYQKDNGHLGVYSIRSDYDKKWFMITVVLQEISPDNNILNKYKTSCKMYINGENMLDRIVESPDYNSENVSSAMKHNKGNLYVAPDGIFKNNGGNNLDTISSEKSLLMANLSYNNYALSPLEIKDLYKLKFTKGAAKLPGILQDDPSLYKYSDVKTGDNLPKAF